MENYDCNSNPYLMREQGQLTTPLGSKHCINPKRSGSSCSSVAGVYSSLLLASQDKSGHSEHRAAGRRQRHDLEFRYRSQRPSLYSQSLYRLALQSGQVNNSGLPVSLYIGVDQDEHSARTHTHKHNLSTIPKLSSHRQSH